MSQTQLQCGTLVQRADKSFHGNLSLIGRFDGAFELKVHPNARHGGESHPDYVVNYMPRGDLGKFQFGVAWLKNSDKVGDFLSISLAHPSWGDDLILQAFPPNTSRDEKDWRVVWSRPRGARVQDQAQAA